jgi:phosphatidylserine/phosphatidylglycerophosphate/cardiolipin synthase-like enzyme
LLTVADETANFHAQLHTKKITLRPQTEQQITVYINPLSHRLTELHYGSVTIEIKSLTDPILQKTHTFTCHLHEPDLKIPKIKTYNNKGTETNVCYQGNIFRVKAFLKNTGDKTARDATVSYFLNTVTSENLLGMKTYETVEQYQKYPSLYLDTKQISPGDHTIIVVADYHDTIKELDEYNNENSIQITILNTTPTPIEQRLLITEFYYYAHPTIHNEFITLFNPTNTTVHLDEWYLTTTVSKRCNDQKKILFPPDTKIQPNSSITLTQNSSAYYQECLTLPDYEYETNSNTSIPQLNTTHSIYLSNKGGAIALKNPFNHTIDVLIYGNTTEHSTHWNGSFIPCINQGEILKRVKENTRFQDTNTAKDWIQPKKYQIGQSTFSPSDFTINASVTPFISPDTSYSVISHFFKNANAEILLNAYEFTSEKITNLLIDALKRNVTITMLIEGSPIGGISEKQTMLLNRLQAHGTTINLLQGNRIDHTYKRYRFTHAKYAIIDQKTVIIHSGNFAPTGIPETPTFGNREWGIALTNETIAEWYASVFYGDANPKQPDTIVYSQNKIFDEHEYFLNEKEYYGWYQPITNQSSTMNKTITVQPVLSPDNSLSTITQFLSNATESIYIQQLYIYPNWTDSTNPLIPLLIQKANQGLDIRIILNYNPWYDSTNIHNNQTKTLLESYGIQVKYVYTNWSIFQNIHNKGAIIDNKSVLISSINWNENSFLNNREIGIIINHSNISQFYSTVFLSDWHLTKPTFNNETFSENNNQSIIELNTNTIYITALFTMTFIVIARDWRKRSWP